MSRIYWILLLVLIFMTPLSVAAEPVVMSEVEQLRQQLEAERALNEQLRRRVNELEKKLQGSGEGENDPTSLVVWDAEPEMARMPDTPDVRSAVDEALLVRELVLLEPGGIQFNPSISWVHDGAGDDRRDSYIFDAQLQVGLPYDFAASLNIPYVKRDYAIGSEDDIGDITLGLRRKLNNETETLPSLIARLDYTHDTDSDAFESVPISSGFRSVQVGLSALKRFDPLVLSGVIAYDHAFEESDVSIKDNGNQLFRGDIERGDLLTLGLNFSLAATPDNLCPTPVA